MVSPESLLLLKLAKVVKELKSRKPEKGDAGRDPTAEEIQTAVGLWMEFHREEVRGKPGKSVPGKDGIGIDDVEVIGSDLVVRLTDGREKRFKLPKQKSSTSAWLGGGGSGLSKSEADELYAPIGSGGGDGKSAYEIAVDEGFSGDESAWLASLKGEQGLQGEVGPKGEQGIQGEQGPIGLTGAKGDAGEQGPKGDTGAQGIQGEKGDAGENAALSDATPQALGTAAAGTSGEGSRADHKHAMPTAAQVGADPAGTAAAGDAAHLAASDPHPQYPLAKFFNSSGEISAQVKIWTGTVTSDGNGDFTVNYSSAGFTSPPMVTVSALSTTTDTVRDKQWATLYGTPTTTSANGYTLRGNVIVAILIGGAETVRDAGNVVVQVHAIGV